MPLQDWVMRITLLVLAVVSIPLSGCGGGQNGDSKDVAVGDGAGWSCGQPDPCGKSSYAEGLPAAGIVYVNVCCAADGTPDGSLEHPFGDIGSGLAASKPGQTIAIAAGVYEESVKVDKNVSLAGAGSDRTLLHSVDDNPTVLLSKVEGGSASGLSLTGAGGVGLLVQDSKDVSLSQLAISGYQESLSGQVGVGLMVSGSTGVAAAGLDVSGNRAYGIYFTASSGSVSGTSVRENGIGCASAGIGLKKGSSLVLGMAEPPADYAQAGLLEAGGCVVADNNAVGFYAEESVVAVNGVEFSGDQCGGMLLHGSSPQSGVSTLAGSVMKGLMERGVEVRGCSLEIADSLFSDVQGKVGGFPGNCVMAVQSGVEGTTVEVIDSRFENCAGAGIFLEGPLLAEVAGNQLTDLGSAGIWAQCGVDVAQIAGNVVEGAGAAGIAVTEGSTALVRDNSVDQTHYDSIVDFDNSKVVDQADGLLVAKIDAINAVLLENNEVFGSQRVGIIIDQANENSVTFGVGNKVAGNADAGISLQNGAETIADAQGVAGKVEFEVEGVGPNGGEGDLVTDKAFDIVTKMCI
ncbi:MAG: hypothetical protein FJ109_19670, partial [Deltaproteobacteria bacterium]|nr:hypothetical protein [Deltaproteobacteria bacterium]